MTQFIELPASKMSLAKRKLVFDTGINDANYIVHRKLNGKIISCPFYSTWRCMLKRCYCERSRSSNSSYIGSLVSAEWHVFSVFKEWMIKQDWQGKQLDKDILIAGNKTYSPQTCVFVSGALNSLLNDNAGIRGEFPQGVNFHKGVGKYRATCKVSGKSRHLGYFSAHTEAELVYLKFKSELIDKIASENEASNNLKLKEALLARSNALKRRVKLLSGY